MGLAISEGKRSILAREHLIADVIYRDLYRQRAWPTICLLKKNDSVLLRFKPRPTAKHEARMKHSIKSLRFE